MSTIVTRAGKGSALTHNEVDANFVNLNTDKAEVASTNTFSASQIISANSSNAALRITQVGSGNALVVEDSTNPDSTPFVVDASGNVGIGVTTAGNPLTIGSTSFTAQLSRFNATAALGGGIDFRRSKSGTVGTNSVLASDDLIARLSFSGADGTNYIRAAEIGAFVDGTPGTNDMPGRLVFSTTADGASSPSERMRIDSKGNVLVKSSGGLGYGTGSGGTVTQITSRTTGVTLNKTNGSITLVSAAGSPTWQTFTVTNSTVEATDTIIVNQKSGTDTYMIHVTNVSTGSFKITFATMNNLISNLDSTGGITVEQPVFNFAVIKAVTS